MIVSISVHCPDRAAYGLDSRGGEQNIEHGSEARSRAKKRSGAGLTDRDRSWSAAPHANTAAACERRAPGVRRCKPAAPGSQAQAVTFSPHVERPELANSPPLARRRSEGYCKQVAEVVGRHRAGVFNAAHFMKTGGQPRTDKAAGHGCARQRPRLRSSGEARAGHAAAPQRTYHRDAVDVCWPAERQPFGLQDGQGRPHPKRTRLMSQASFRPVSMSKHH